MLHVGGVLQHSGALCCTWTSSCNIRGYYVARAPRLAIFEGTMLHVHLLLQHSRVLCCTCTFSCNIRGYYVARAPRLATFGSAMLHVDLVLQHSRVLCCTCSSSCNVIPYLLKQKTEPISLPQSLNYEQGFKSRLHYLLRLIFDLCFVFLFSLRIRIVLYPTIKIEGPTPSLGQM